MSKYHEKFFLPDNIINNDVTSDKSLDELTDEVQNQLQAAASNNELFAIKGPQKAQLFDPQKLVVFEIEKVN